MARFSASALSSRLLLGAVVCATEPRREVDGVEGEAAEDEAEDSPANVSEKRLLSVLLGVPAGEGGEGISSVMDSVSQSPSAAGKKLRNRPLACHFDAFLNSIQTSMRPGRQRAGSSFSRWFVVL